MVFATKKCVIIHFGFVEAMHRFIFFNGKVPDILGNVLMLFLRYWHLACLLQLFQVMTKINFHRIEAGLTKHCKCTQARQCSLLHYPNWRIYKTTKKACLEIVGRFQEMRQMPTLQRTCAAFPLSVLALFLGTNYSSYKNIYGLPPVH